MKVSNSGRITFYNSDGLYHRFGGPAIICPYDTPSYDIEFKSSKPMKFEPDGIYKYYVNGKNITNEIKKWMGDCGYSWEKMSDVEKWELELFMRSL